ncbi:MAG TPA: polymer-forming cytoskeletal protein [Gemmatimonadales bacterium]|nr:polymer-forming cytoskeletal protein [Gemmatimonadales bacterium]
MMRFKQRTSEHEEPAAPNTMIGVGASFRGTLMVTGTLRIDGEFDGDILNCDRLEIGEHGMMRADIEVKEAVVRGRVIGNIRALGVLDLKAGARIEGDVTAFSVTMEPGVFFSGRCTMLESGADGMQMNSDPMRVREVSRT